MIRAMWVVGSFGIGVLAAVFAAQPPGDESSAAKYDHTKVSVVCRDGHEQPIKSMDDLLLRRTHTLLGMQKAMGELPSSDRRCPLDVKIESESESDGVILRRITFAPEEGDRVPALVMMKKSIASDSPAMLCLHQTTGIGKGEPAGLGGLENLHYAKELAARGFVCLVPDYPSFGDYPYDFRTQGKHYASGSMKAIWNNIRAVDLLCEMKEVDPSRIGCIGHSLGGHNTLFTAAFDQRIRAVVTSCGFTGFHDYYKGNLQGWTSDRYMPRIREIYGNDPDKVPFDFPEILAAIVPRAIFVNAPLNDDNFDNQGVRKVIAEVRPLLSIAGVSDNSLVAEYPDCAHDFPDDVRERAYKWLEKQLAKPLKPAQK
ncbi:MAG: alpha/beta fold hydrolase [Planctomycetaceae bacterium]|nr:alpha/beta fold hydrolase [Planctomycetaceae bacterium]